MENKDLNKEKVKKYLKEMGYKDEEIEKMVNGIAYKSLLQQVLTYEKCMKKVALDYLNETNKKRR